MIDMVMAMFAVWCGVSAVLAACWIMVSLTLGKADGNTCCSCCTCEDCCEEEDVWFR